MKEREKIFVMAIAKPNGKYSVKIGNYEDIIEYPTFEEADENAKQLTEHNWFRFQYEYISNR